MSENWKEKIDKEMAKFPNVHLDPHERECARVLVRDAIEKREEREKIKRYYGCNMLPSIKLTDKAFIVWENVLKC